MQSGYYRTLNDSKVFDVPWPNDFVYHKNGKKASYHTLSVPEFVQGYCAIVMANITVMEEMKALINHVGYLASVMNDTEGSSWEMVLNSHRQILHMIQQAQLKWEDVAARIAAIDRQLLRAERVAALPKVVKSQNIVNNNVHIPKGQPCSLFQSGRCSYVTITAADSCGSMCVLRALEWLGRKFCIQKPSVRESSLTITRMVGCHSRVDNGRIDARGTDLLREAGYVQVRVP